MGEAVAGAEERVEAGLGSVSLVGEAERRWKYRYHAAAIYVEQGENNEKFTSHPTSHRALPAYVLVHNEAFYVADLCASLLLLSLALIETPASVPGVDQLPWLHSMLELVCLALISLEVAVKVQWLGWRQWSRHVRSLLKTAVLAVMVVEAGVVLVRNRSHFRITRALRPIFLIDSHYCYNVRRFVRQTLQSLPAVLDMLVLLIAVMGVFSVLGFFFYRRVDPEYFADPVTAFVSLFVLLTTANNPDVMMKAYAASRWNALFFIAFTCIELYFLMNLLLAVVYDTFASNEKAKFRKLYLHKREALGRALALVAEEVGEGQEGTPREVSVERFLGMLSYLRRFTSLRDAFLCFCAVNRSGSGRVSEEEFLNLYDVLSMSWSRRDVPDQSDRWTAFRLRLRRAVLSRPFRGLFYAISFLTGLWYFIEVFFKSSEIASLQQDYVAVSVGFCSIFTLEILLKVAGLGPREFWRSGWNTYDLFVTGASVMGVAFYRADHPLTHLILLRFLSLARLLRLKKSYRDIFDTVAILVPRFTSAGIVLLVIYYFFAIVGMECFATLTPLLKNCCNDTLVAAEFVWDPAAGRVSGYYLNSFDNLLVSAVTLWDLMVVNNWFIIMEGFASVAETGWARTFFMLYFLVMMCVLNIVVAFILEGFLFRIQCSRAAVDDQEERGYKTVELGLPRAEVELLCGKGSTVAESELRAVREARPQEEEMGTYVGFRWKDRSDFSQELYASEVSEWVRQRFGSLASPASSLSDDSHHTLLTD